MRILFVDHSNRLTSELREKADRDLLLVLSKYSNEIRQTTITVAAPDAHADNSLLELIGQVTLRSGASATRRTHESTSLRDGIARLALRLGRAVDRALADHRNRQSRYSTS